MSMGYCANFAEVIEEKALAAIVGNDANGVSLVKQLHTLIDDTFSCEADAVDCITYECDDYDEAETQKFIDLLNEIQEKFKQETGLRLELCYHDADNDGDCYDEVEGLYWEVFGCYVKSPELAALEQKYGDWIIGRKFFVIYG